MKKSYKFLLSFLPKQAALVIRGFVIRDFDYSQLVNCVQNLLSADISLGYLRVISWFDPF